MAPFSVNRLRISVTASFPSATVGILIVWSGSSKHHEITTFSIVDYQVKRTVRRRPHKFTVRMEYSVDQSSTPGFYLRHFSLAPTTSSSWRRPTRSSLTPHPSLLSQYFIDINIVAYILFGIAWYNIFSADRKCKVHAKESDFCSDGSFLQCIPQQVYLQHIKRLTYLHLSRCDSTRIRLMKKSFQILNNYWVCLNVEHNSHSETNPRVQAYKRGLITVHSLSQEIFIQRSNAQNFHYYY